MLLKMLLKMGLITWKPYRLYFLKHVIRKDRTPWSMNRMDGWEDQWVCVTDFGVEDLKNLKRCCVMKNKAFRLTAGKAVWVKMTKRWQSDNRFTSFITFLLAPENPSCQNLSELLKQELTATFSNHRHIVGVLVSGSDMYPKDFVVWVLLSACKNPHFGGPLLCLLFAALLHAMNK